MDTEIEILISINKSKFHGYQSKKGNKGKITLFISELWKNSDNDIDNFIEGLDCIYLIERVCLERAFQKIRLKNRCNPCKVQRVCVFMQYPEYWDQIRKY